MMRTLRQARLEDEVMNVDEECSDTVGKSVKMTARSLSCALHKSLSYTRM